MKKGNWGVFVAVTALGAVMAYAVFELVQYMAAVKEVSKPVTGKMYDYSEEN